VQGILEKVNIKKTQLFINYNNYEALETEHGHICNKCDFIPPEDVCNVIDNLPSMEESLPVDTKMGLVYIAGYVVRKDEKSGDSELYSEKFGCFLKDIDRGGLSVPGDSVCQWVIYSYITFHQVVNASCRKSLSNILMTISEMYNFNMATRHATILSNVLFNNYCHLYTPRSGKEAAQKVIKLNRT
jgi:hypothetical protein